MTITFWVECAGKNILLFLFIIMLILWHLNCTFWNNRNFYVFIIFWTKVVLLQFIVFQSFIVKPSHHVPMGYLFTELSTLCNIKIQKKCIHTFSAFYYANACLAYVSHYVVRMLRASIRMSSNFSFRSTVYKLDFEPNVFFTAHRSRIDEQAVCWS